MAGRSHSGLALAIALILGGCGAGQTKATSNGADVAAQALVEFDIDKCRGLAHQRAMGVLIGDDIVATVSHAFLDPEGTVSVEAFEIVAASGQRLSGEIVYLDPATDVALVAVEGLSAEPLHLAEAGEDDSVRFITRRDGDHGGQSNTVVVDATVLQATTLTLDGAGARAGLELAAVVEHGDSGAPLLDDGFQVVGIVFASSRATEIGWAIAASEYMTAMSEVTVNEATRLPLEGGSISIGC